MENLEYQNYIKWKGWLTEKNMFFSVTNYQSEEFESQFRESKVDFKNINVLEIGYGSGSLLKFFQMNGCKISGIEIQQELIDLANKAEIKVYRNIKETKENYDLIIALDVLEHLYIDQLKELFLVASVKLNTGGKMMFRFPNADSYAGMAAQNGDYTHVTSIGKSKLQQLIEPYGFVIESFKGAIEYPHRPVSRIIHWIFRTILIKLIGFNRPYFFSGNVVAVIKKSYNIDKGEYKN